ncbi:MAG TPA: TIGR03013 family XrtA/PEP-CTERM system glycosyltransferase, partial [Acetobacteraceae bacterium]|nr:TIGR03013 family XrtA/PEP-CTERM system glycosyltransferase [Acetobacteraceae bacterium]
PVEMALLGAMELLLSFAAIYAMAVVPETLGTHPFRWLVLDPHSAHNAALLTASIGLCAVTIGLYRPEICLDRRRLVLNAAVAAVLAFPVALVVSGQFSTGFSRTYAIWLAKVLILWIGFAVVSRSVLSRALRQRLFARPILVVGAAGAAKQTAEAIRGGRGKLFELAGLSYALTDVAGMTQEALRRRGIWGVVVATDRLDVAGPAEAEERQRLLDWRLRGVRVYDDVSFWEQHLGRVNLDRIDAGWFLRAEGFANGPLSRAVKRLIDIAVSLLLLILTLPLMICTAIVIKLDSPGPILYHQQRAGLHGQPFTLLKFRSMVADAEAEGAPRWAAKRDPRVTRIGAFIRSIRIDELPQLLNVLQGQMSLIGPRPERPHFVAQLTQVIPFYHQRSYVKPGITGWAQVNFPYGASVEDARAKLSYDLYYVKNRSTFLDLLILISTVRVILFREGAR